MKNELQHFEKWFMQADTWIAGMDSRQTNAVRELALKAFRAGAKKAIDSQIIDCSKPGVMETLRHDIKVMREKKAAK